MNEINTGEIVLYHPDACTLRTCAWHSTRVLRKVQASSTRETIGLDVWIKEEIVCLTQAQMSVLFGRDRTVISRHIRNIFTEGELGQSKVCAFFAHTTQHGAIVGKTQTMDILYYNKELDTCTVYEVHGKPRDPIGYLKHENK